MKHPHTLSDEELLNNLVKLNSNEITLLVEILEHLIEVDKRRLYLEKGFSSLFSYCVSVLKYCEATAGRRISAIRCISKFPELLVLLREQKVTLTSIVLVSRILTEENFKEVTKAILNQGKAEVERYVSTYLPKKEVRESIKVIPSGAVESPSLSLNLDTKNTAPQASLEKNNILTIKQPNENEAPPVELEPTFEIKLKASNSALAKLKRIQELRGKKESLGDLFELLMEEYLDRHSPEAREERRKKRMSKGAYEGQGQGQDKGIKSAKGSEDRKVSRYIPRKVRDRVYREHKGRCSYVSPEGNRCTCKARLQVDHVYPFSLGGSNKIENLRLLCPAHNRFMAERVFGKEKMIQFAKRIVI